MLDCLINKINFIFYLSKSIKYKKYNNILLYFALIFKFKSYKIYFINNYISNISNLNFLIIKKKYIKNLYNKKYIFFINKIINNLYIIHINYGYNNINIIKNLIYLNIFKINLNINFLEHYITINNSTICTNNKYIYYIYNNIKVFYIKFLIEYKKNFYFFINEFYLKKRILLNNNYYLICSGYTYHLINVFFNYYKSFFYLYNFIYSYIKTSLNEFYTYILHNNNNCISKQLHKIILNNKNILLLNNLIKIKKNSLFNKSNINNNNLLLHKDSKIYSKPYIKIYNNKNICNHSVSIYNINEKELFFLKTRSLLYKNIINIIIYYILINIINNIKIYVLKYIIIKNIFNIIYVCY